MTLPKSPDTRLHLLVEDRANVRELHRFEYGFLQDEVNAVFKVDFTQVSRVDSTIPDVLGEVPVVSLHVDRC